MQNKMETEVGGGTRRMSVAGRAGLLEAQGFLPSGRRRVGARVEAAAGAEWDSGVPLQSLLGTIGKGQVLRGHNYIDPGDEYDHLHDSPGPVLGMDPAGRALQEGATGAPLSPAEVAIATLALDSLGLPVSAGQAAASAPNATSGPHFFLPEGLSHVRRGTGSPGRSSERNVWHDYSASMLAVILMLFRTQRFPSTTLAEMWFLYVMVLLGAAMQATFVGQLAFLISSFNER